MKTYFFLCEFRRLIFFLLLFFSFFFRPPPISVWKSKNKFHLFVICNWILFYICLHWSYSILLHFKYKITILFAQIEIIFLIVNLTNSLKKNLKWIFFSCKFPPNLVKGSRGSMCQLCLQLLHNFLSLVLWLRKTKNRWNIKTYYKYVSIILRSYKLFDKLVRNVTLK